MIGGGLGSLIMQKIKGQYPDKKIIAFTVLPSPYVSDVVVEPYNAVLSINEMQEYCDGVFAIDNEALFNMVKNIYGIRQPKYDDLNFIANGVINDITSIFRYNDSYGFNVTSFLEGMVKIPRLKYFCLSKNPFYDEKDKLVMYESCDDPFVATKKLFDLERSFVVKYEYNYLQNLERHCASPHQRGYTQLEDNLMAGAYKNMCTLMIYRGFDNVEGESIVKRVQESVQSRHFMSDIISTEIRYKAQNEKGNMLKSVAMIENSTLIRHPFQRIHIQSGKMYKRKR